MLVAPAGSTRLRYGAVRPITIQPQAAGMGPVASSLNSIQVPTGPSGPNRYQHQCRAPWTRAVDVRCMQSTCRESHHVFRAMIQHARDDSPAPTRHGHRRTFGCQSAIRPSSRMAENRSLRRMHSASRKVPYTGRIKPLPTCCQRKPIRRSTLPAEGSTTGHPHRFRTNDGMKRTKQAACHQRGSL